MLNDNYDVIVIGTGVAGLYTTLHLDRSLRILLVTKRDLSFSNSALAQGGIAGVYDFTNDSPDIHFEDTMVAGGHTNNKRSLRILVDEAYNDLNQLIDYGVEFDRDSNGQILLTLEGGHSRPRILHHKDSSGREIIDKLILAVKALPNVTILESAHVMDLQKRRDTFTADILIGDTHIYPNSNCCVVATGGIGRLYEYTTNSAIATGDGIMLAHKMGAVINNLSKVQFHPTAFANKQTRECFLISEAVRGEGAYLLNCHHERFMDRYDNRLELAPRDVVSKAIIEESKLTGSSDFYLDITHKDASYIKKRFPMIYKNLLNAGYDLTTDLIPVYPCQHYLMGGIDVDVHGRTSIEGLYAVGECSHTGVHGENRLASNSLLEGVVFSRRAAHSINWYIKNNEWEVTPAVMNKDYSGPRLPKGIRTSVRSIMQSAHFVIKDRKAALDGFVKIDLLMQMMLNNKFMRNAVYVEARSLITVAYLMLQEVILREEQ